MAAAPNPAKKAKKQPNKHKRSQATGFRGVTRLLDRDTNPYYAYVDHAGKTLSLGCYPDIDSALQVRELAVSHKEQGAERLLAWYEAFREERKRQQMERWPAASLPKHEADGTRIPLPEERPVRGISKRGGIYVAQVYHDGKTVSIGTFPSYQEAVDARLLAEKHLNRDFDKWLARFREGRKKSREILLEKERKNRQRERELLRRNRARAREYKTKAGNAPAT